MVRYGAFIFMNFFITLYAMWFAYHISTMLTRLNILRGYLFEGDVDPTLLDSRITYECSPLPNYSLSTLPENKEALAFYETKWTSPLYKKTLDYSL